MVKGLSTKLYGINEGFAVLLNAQRLDVPGRILPTFWRLKR